MPDRHEPVPPQRRPVAEPPFDPVSLFAVPIGRTASPPGDPLPVTETLYRTGDGRYAVRTCLHLGARRSEDVCDVMIYDDEAALREALSADGNGLDRALLAAAGLDRDGE